MTESVYGSAGCSLISKKQSNPMVATDWILVLIRHSNSSLLLRWIRDSGYKASKKFLYYKPFDVIYADFRNIHIIFKLLTKRTIYNTN